MRVGEQRRKFLGRAIVPRVIIVALGATGLGCLHMKPSLRDPDPANRIPAIVAAGENKDEKALPQLVKALDDEDPAVRFYAIEALTHFTGTTFGYVFYAEPEKRAPAADRWQQWLNKR